MAFERLLRIKRNNKDKDAVINLHEELGFERPLTFSEMLLLSYFAIFETDNVMLTEISLRLMKSSKEYDDVLVEKFLLDKGIIQRGGYSFTLRDMYYKIAPQYLAVVLIWLYETQDGHKCLDVMSKAMKKYSLAQKPVQISLCEYIQSGFKDTSSAVIIFGSDIDYLLPIVEDDRFIAYITKLSETAFIALIEATLRYCYTSGEIVSGKRLLTLVSAHAYSVDQRFTELQTKVSLYAFLAEGIMPDKKVIKKSLDGLLLQAIIKTYKGQYAEALKDFRQVQVMFNKEYGKSISNNIVPHSICNFIYLLCCYHDGSDASQRIIQNFLRRNETEKSNLVRGPWALMAALTNRRNYSNDMSLFFSSSDGITRQLLVLIVRFLGKTNIISDEDIINYAPQWLCLRYEYDKYSPMSDAERKIANKAYCENHLLSSIYVKQQWEQVIEALSGKVSTKAEEVQQTERLAYFMRNINDDVCEVRQQSVLKSGGWGAGKQLSYANFMGMNDDRMSVADMRIRDRERYGSKMSTYYIQLANVLPEMAENSRLYVGRWAPFTLVTVNEEMPYLVIEKSHVGFSIKSNVPIEEVDKSVIVVSRGASSLNYLKMTEELRPYFSQLLDLGRFPLEAEESLKQFLEGLRGKVEVHSELVSGGSTLETVKGTSSITLQMRPQGKEAYIVSIFCRPLENGRAQCVPGEGSSVIVDIDGDHRVCVERDLQREKEIYYNLVNGLEETLPPEKTFQVDAFGLLPILDFIREQNTKQAMEATSNAENAVAPAPLYTVEWPEGQKLNIHNRYTASQWNASLKKNKNGWFEMEGTVQLDEKTKVSMAQLLDLIGQSRNRFIRLGDGEYLALSERLRKQLSALDILASRSRGKLQMSAFSAALLDTSVVDGELHLDVAPELLEVRKRILDSSEYRPNVPKTLKASLREYQKEGFQWISRLNSWGAGALLADDMGLGKTVQTIAFMLFKAKEGPSLVVAPASVAPNWKSELKKFAPSLNVEVLNFAVNRSKCIANAKAGDVVITTYGLLLSVKDEITQKDWTTAVLDEAHVIKNRGAKTSGVAMKLKTQYRIMLTGTPVQNHLGELWNLFQFVNPGLLGSYEDFNQRFITPIEIGGDKERQKDLDRLVHPFMLRRTKEKVLNELPEKTEIYQTVELSKEEMAVYEVIREKAEQLLEAEGSDKVSINTLAEITRLRQAACSAELIEKTWKGKTSKVEALVEALEPIIESGDAALVFSQFTSFLAIVKKALDKAKIPYLYIDGTVSVKEREKLVQQFQNGECPVFIISLKAGGLGLNLTRANYVFHLDPWWNPAIEQQATDRAHRMGQHNAVTVYHFLSEGTIEEKIKRLHERKRDLADNILEGTDMSGKITGKELLDMISN